MESFIYVRQSLAQPLKRTIETASEISGWLAATMIVTAVLLTCEMIFARFVLNISTSWQTEVVVYLMVDATLIGLAFVQKHKGHVGVDLLPIWLGPLAGRMLVSVTRLAAIVVIAVCFWYGLELWHQAYTSGWRSETVTAVPLWIPYVALPVGFGLLLLQLGSDFAVSLKAPTLEWRP